jgi:hypothetical protein
MRPYTLYIDTIAYVPYPLMTVFTFLAWHIDYSILNWLFTSLGSIIQVNDLFGAMAVKDAGTRLEGTERHFVMRDLKMRLLEFRGFCIHVIRDYVLNRVSDRKEMGALLSGRMYRVDPGIYVIGRNVRYPE